MIMKKILLLGNPNDIVNSLYHCLSNDFQVQLCFGELENSKAIYKITAPDMMIVNQLETEDIDPAVLEWLKALTDHIPVLFITQEERWTQYKAYWEDSSFERMFRPVTKAELIQKCYQLLRAEPVQVSVSSSHEQKRIMIVDDSPLVLRSLKTLLGEEYIVSLATSGEQALSLVPKKNPDLILLDYEMPGLDGKKTYEILKEQEESSNIPVIFLTSVSDKEHISAILETNPADYILKPPDQDRLFQSIKRVLGKESII